MCRGRMQNFPKELQLFFVDEDGQRDGPRCRTVHFEMSGQLSEHRAVLVGEEPS